MWLLDNLKKDCPSARILTYGYDSKLEESNSFQTLEDLTIAFVKSLQVVREQDFVSADAIFFQSYTDASSRRPTYPSQ